MARVKTYKELLQAIEKVNATRKETAVRLEKNTAEVLKPSNLLREIFHSIANDASLKQQLLTGGIKTGAGIIAGRFFFGKSTLMVKLAGTILTTIISRGINEKNISTYAPRIKKLITELRRRYN